MEKNKMLIDASHPEETRVVVLRNGRVEEFDYESAARKLLRGNIYLAKVTRVEPSLQAAFVDYGGNRHGFLAFNEIHPDYYQIPIADREALKQEEAEAEAAAEAEVDARARRRERSRRRPADRSRGESEASGYDNGDASHLPEPEAPYDVEPLAHDNGSSVRHSDVDQDAPSLPGFETVGGMEGGEPREQGSHGEDGGVIEVGGTSEGGHAEPEQIEQVAAGEDALEEVPERPRRRARQYKIQEVIKRRQIILVQVVKEERGNKGAALTTYISLAGRYTVLMPNTGRGGGISRKITQPQDRRRLKAIAEELDVPEGMGLIIRTAGAARTKQEIKRDYEYLLRLWESVRDMTLVSTAPCLVYEEGNLIKRSIRDLYSKDIDDVVVGGEAAHREASDFMGMLMPGHADSVVRYEGSEPLFTRYGIERQLNAMFSPYVTLRSGGYLVINQTEALVSIDVNSGKSTREFSIEETALNTNIEAADEIARQLKLRDLAGLIVIDFIDMEEKRNNRAVERRLKDALRHDRARIQVGRISHFGLLEMSRQRLRTGVLEGSTSQCPHCQGTGIIRSTESVALAVLRGLEDHLLKQPSSLVASTTATVALYILNNKRNFILEMERREGVTITIEANERMQGANFSIERSSAPTTKPAARTAAVSMDWAFDGDEDAADDSAESEETVSRSQRDHDHHYESRDHGPRDHVRSSSSGRDEDDEGGAGDEGRPGRRRRRRRGRRDGRDRGGADQPRQSAADAGSDRYHETDEPARSDRRGDSDRDGRGERRFDRDDTRYDDRAPDRDDDRDAVTDAPRAQESAADGSREEERSRRSRRRGRRGGRSRGRDAGGRSSGEHGDMPEAERDAVSHGPDFDRDAEPRSDRESRHEASEGGFEAERAERAPSRRSEETYPRETDAAGRETRYTEPVQTEREHGHAGRETAAHTSPETHAADDRSSDASASTRKGWWQRRFGNG